MSQNNQSKNHSPLLSSPTESLSDYIRQHCRKHNISLERLAEQAGIARGTLYAILEDKSIPKIPHLLSLAKAMGVHHYFLFRLKWRELDAISPSHSESNLHKDMSGFIDETIPDGTLIMAGTSFEKTWTIQNVGEVVWNNRYFMHLDAPYRNTAYPNGQNLSDYHLFPNETLIAIPTTYPGQTCVLKVTYTAPKVAGRYISYWQMVDEAGRACFPNGVGLSTSILVLGFGVNQNL